MAAFAITFGLINNLAAAATTPAVIAAALRSASASPPIPLAKTTIAFAAALTAAAGSRPILTARVAIASTAAWLSSAKRSALPPERVAIARVTISILPVWIAARKAGGKFGCGGTAAKAGNVVNNMTTSPVMARIFPPRRMLLNIDHPKFGWIGELKLQSANYKLWRLICLTSNYQLSCKYV
ncbi:MAG: hypothetical protein V1797_20040 [Pseudomonadota bacterium]